MKTKKGSCWTAYYDPDMKRYIAEIIYTSRGGLEQYDYEITQAIYDRLGSFSEDYDNEALIRTGKQAYSFENTMYGTLGPGRVFWDEDAYEVMQQSIRKNRERKNGDESRSIDIFEF